MQTTFSRWLLGIAVAFNLAIAAQAQMAQVPMLTQSTAVEPNLVFVFDDSGSMAADYMYQYGTSWGGMGMANPGGDEAAQSPDVNVMYYDPRILYKRRVNSDGSEMALGSTASIGSFFVYFYYPGSGSTKKVSSVSVTNGGSKYPYDSSLAPTYTSMTMTFSSPPSGGVRATGTVTVNSSKQITAITVTNAGSGYTSAPSISLVNKSKGKSFKYTVNMVAESSATDVNRVWPGVGSVSSISNFYAGGSPAGYTPDATSPLVVGADATVAYPNEAKSSITRYPKFAARTDCSGVNASGTYIGQTYCTWANELQNYANWKAYHNTRVNLARTGIGLAFKPLAATFRLGWGTINRIESGSNLDAGVSMFTQTRKDAFYTWLYGSNTNPSGDTPNRLAMDRVGQYFSRSDSKGPWGTTPDYTSVSTSASTTTSGDTAASKAAQASCRRSNMLLLTDGYWNGSSSSLSNIDNTNGPTITSPSGATYQYTPVYPHIDSVSNTLADVAMKYWVNDLRSDLTNNVPAITGLNESFWQNVSFYGIGLGIYGTLVQNDAVLASLALGPSSGGIAWPTATSNNPSAIDDMWHAAINSRGKFLNAKDSNSLNDSIEKMMASISKLSSSQSGVAVSTANLISGTRKYTPQYTTGSWAGNVTSRALDPLTGNEISTAWQVERKDAVTGNSISMVPDAAERQIFVGNGASTSPKAVAFNYADMAAAGLTGLMTGTVNADLINYLRGDPSLEGDAGNFRPREARLGDIVNSSPVFVKNGINMHYENLPSSISGGSSYGAYIAAKAARTEGVLFVGANDGMLHAFRDGPLGEVVAAGDSSIAGEEIFAYVPRAVLPTLSALADKAYSHKYYVDGPLVETDAYLGGAWANVLVGTTGPGAKAVFALEVPADPTDVDVGNILWEISSTTTGFSELGHVLTDVQTGVLPSGEWVAIFGNGYFSASGSAQLFVVNLQTGALIQKIDTATGPSNGLGGVTVVRGDSGTTKGQIIGAYAGDLKGNLWKFDLSSVTSAGGFVGLSGVPLMTAGSTKPITALPAAIRHPQGGYLVAAGTGKFFEAGDVSTTSQQSLYGVWDSVAFGSTTTPAGVTQTGVSNLVQQTIATGTTVTRTFITPDLSTETQTVTYYEVSKNPISWATKRGWYIDLPNTGQRVVYPLQALENRYLAIDTISPSNVSTNACVTSGQGTGWVYLVDGLTGAGPAEQVLDTNGDGNVDTADSLVSGFTARADGRNTWLKVDGLSSESVTVMVGITGSDGTGMKVKLTCALLNNCASSIPSISSIKSREWRQLFMR
jgi:type IV pilus assembly protein PilY1